MRRLLFIASLLWACKPADPLKDPPVDPTTPTVPTEPTEPTDPTDPTEPVARVVISEVMPGNRSTIDAADDDDEKPDWFELQNRGDASVNLSTLSIRNDDGDLATLPDEELGPNEIRLFFAGPKHEVPFSLDKENDKLTLLEGELTVDFVDIDDVGNDISLARMNSLDGEFGLTALPTPGEENGEEPSATLDPASETVFQKNFVHQITFTVGQQALTALDEWDRPEVHVGLDIDGVKYDDVGLKLKGSASYDTMAGKPAFMLDLNQWVSGTKFRGLKHLKLHNGNVLDPTRVRDYLTYKLAREAGLWAPRVGWAEVYVNNDYYGIYMVIERHDDEWIEYFDPLQKDVGVVLEPNEGWYDFGSGTITETTMATAYEEGPIPPDPTVLTNLQAINSLLQQSATDANVTEFWNYVEKDKFLTYLAWETLVMHTDGYRAPNNWRLFMDGTTFKTWWVPAGAEWTWDFEVAVYPTWGGSAIGWCNSNPGCRRDFSEEVLVVADLVESLDLLTEFNDLSAWLDPIIDVDPRYSSWETVADARQSTGQHLGENPERARTQVYAEYPDLVP